MTVPAPVPGRRRAARRRPLIIGISILGLLTVLAGLDRAAAAYAGYRIAGQIQQYGFPHRPAVTVEGIPFLTQVATRHLDGVHIYSSGLRAGPVTATINAQATGIVLNSGYSGGVIAHLNATGVISFASIASLASSAGVPGLKVSAAGPDELKLSVNLQVVSASMIARIKRVNSSTFMIHVVSTGGLPLSSLGSFPDLTVQIPALPMGMTVQRLSVTAQGVVIRATGSGFHFGH